MPDHRVPQWHPISALPMIAQALDGMVESAEDVLQSLEQGPAGAFEQRITVMNNPLCSSYLYRQNGRHWFRFV